MHYLVIGMAKDNTYMNMIKDRRPHISTPKLKKVFLKFAELALTGIIFAIVASLLTANIIDRKEQQRTINRQLDSLSSVYIGCSKQWVDETFGYPQFIGQKEDYLLCAYVSDYFILQVAFDPTQSAQAYLITSLNNSKKVTLQINDSTLRTANGFTLGDLSYYDFPGNPESVYGFVSNGNARAFYSESYYFMSWGNYYNYHIASFDYGKTGKNTQSFISSFIFTGRDPVDDEVIYSKNCGLQIINDRKNNYPNSYGVSTQDVDMTELLFSYDWFNSQQLRNKLNVDDNF